jgi:hypothetical protein
MPSLDIEMDSEQFDVGNEMLRRVGIQVNREVARQGATPT